MISFSQYISEAADSAQNLHLTHADEDLYERGDKGAQAAVDFVSDVAKGLGKGETNITVKWDGAPAVFAGWDPADGKFFVGTKSVFNKNPKIYKTATDIAANESGGKAEKLRVSLEYLPKIGIPKGKVLQGDLLWTSGDQRYETIDGKRWITVHPNTIVYAWPSESDMGKKVAAAKMGIVWHTTYSGKGDLSSFRASFGVDAGKLKQTRDCWSDDAYFKDVDGTFSVDEYNKIVGLAQQANGLVGSFDRVAELMNSLPSGVVGANVKTFINSYIRKGKYPNPDKAFDEYVEHVKQYWQKQQIDKVKTEASKETKRAALNQFLNELSSIKPIMVKSFKFVHLITQAKMIIVEKFNTLNKQSMFVKTRDGYKVTAPEGYVAIGKDGSAVKFVDRLSFSHFNFSADYLKGWQK